jgi:hypothetical protein
MVRQKNAPSWSVSGVADDVITDFEVSLSRGVEQFCG